jgi:hypothetical protein
MNADQKFVDIDFHEAKNIEKRCKFAENQVQLHTVIYYTVYIMQASQNFKKYYQRNLSGFRVSENFNFVNAYQSL